VRAADEEVAERWLPLGDVAYDASLGFDVDAVARERYWLLRDYAKKRHLKLNVGKSGIEIGVRAQRGPRHPKAKEATDIVSVCDEESSVMFDVDAHGPCGRYPARLQLLNQAEPVTASMKARALNAASHLGTA